MRELAFVLTEGQNAFFVELTRTLRDELGELGVPATISVGWPPPADGRAYALVAPHEHAILAGPRGLPAAVLPRTVCVCTEQPGTAWFDHGARVASRCGAALDINGRGVEELRRRGVGAERLQLGYTPRWDRYAAGADRDLDLAFIGSVTGRRERLLAGAAPVLTRHRCRLVLSDSWRPNPASSGSYLAGQDKFELLSRSRVLLNLHQQAEPYFEWVRVLEAIHCGTAVVSEWSREFEPLVPGMHFMSARPESVAEVAESLILDEAARQRMARDAYEFIREQLPLRPSVQRLAEAAERISAQGLGRRGRFRGRGPEPRLREVLAAFVKPPRRQPDDGAAVKRERLEAKERAQQLARVEEERRRGERLPELERVAATPAHAGASPRVTVICPLYNHAGVVGQALASLAAQTFADWELVVCDDGSTDGSEDVVQKFMEGHPSLAALLVRHPVNRGLPAATRNTAISVARGEYVLALDSDNVLYPHCMDRLVNALDAASDADFAYGILEQFDASGPVGLSGYFGWEPERLVQDNYIDALALLRRSTVAELDGYSEDRRLFGWEDYDLWCRIAERGGRAAHVPEILARYRLAAGSTLSLTNLSTREARAALAEHCPTLFAGIDPAELDERRAAIRERAKAAVREP
jgi:hypothetical protein